MCQRFAESERLPKDVIARERLAEETKIMMKFNGAVDGAPQQSF